MNELSGYELSRRWFDFCFENPEKISPTHTAIYFFAIEHCNRMGWKEKFGFPSQMTMDALGISKYSTYIKYFNELVNWGFLKLIQKSQNQYSANIISLQIAIPKNGKALDKALVRHGVKQSEKQLNSEGESNHKSNHESDGSIDKQYNNKQETREQGNKGIFPTMPKFSDVEDLPKIYFPKIIELMKRTKQVDVTNEDISIMFEIFKVQCLTGKKYFGNIEEVYSYFMNWIPKKDFKKIKEQENGATARQIEEQRAEAILNS